METGHTVAASPAPGWYADPANSANARWWDGTHWTDQVRFATPELHYVEPIVVPDAVTHHSIAAPAHAETPATAAYVPFANERVIAASLPQRGISYTRAGWWISAAPIWSVIPQAVLAAALTVFNIGVTGPFALAILGIALVTWLILLRLAFADASGLRTGGNGSAASPFWILLSPLAYLIARGLEIKRWDSSGWGALIWWIAATVLSPVVALIAFFATMGLVP